MTDTQDIIDHLKSTIEGNKKLIDSIDLKKNLENIPEGETKEFLKNSIDKANGLKNLGELMSFTSDFSKKMNNLNL